MHNKLRTIVIVFAFLTNLVACDTESWNEGFSPADHFIRNKFSMGYSGAAYFHKDHEALFWVELKSFKEPLTKVDLKISLPPEMKLLNGNLHWKGDIEPRSGVKLGLHVHSKKDMKDWSSPITMHVVFLYKGERIIGDEKRSDDCNKKRCPTIWTKNGKIIDSYEEIDKAEWLLEQKVDNEK
jgi:hypothetical protein